MIGVIDAVKRPHAVKRPRRRRRGYVFRRINGRRVRATGEHCAHCKRKLRYVTKKVWRATGPNVAIRCLDCRLAFCPPCARHHFAPVIRAQEKLMTAVVKAAIKAMRIKCRSR